MPESYTAGSYDIPIEASNSYGTFSQDFTLNVALDLAITSADNGALTVGKNGSITITTSTTGSTPSLTESGDLPQGVTFTDNGNGTAVISGIPAAGTSTTYNLALTAANTTDSFTQYFTLTIQDAPQITSAANTYFGVGNDTSFEITTYGLPYPTLTEIGKLPLGLSFSQGGDGTAYLEGTPAAGTVGTYYLTLTATNGIGSAATQSFTLFVGNFTNNSTATFTVGQAGTFKVTTTGFPTGISLVNSGWGLPQGLNFTDNGNGTATISGTPAASTGGTYTISISVMQGSNTLYTQDLTLNVNDVPLIDSGNNDFFIANASNEFGVGTYGLPAPSMTVSGTLPSGVTFTDFGNGYGELSGTPPMSAVGTYQFTITAQNSLGSNTQNFTLVVGTTPTITSADATIFAVGQSNTFTVTSTGTPISALTEWGDLPQGVTFTDNGDGTATLAGTPATGTAGTYNITIDAQNGTNSETDQDFTLIVGTGVAFTGNTSATFLVGQNSSFTVTTVGTPTASLSESGTLPTGLTFTDNGDGTATLSGTPAAGTNGYFPFSVTADDGIDPTVTQDFDLYVYVPTQITSAPTASFTVGQYSNFTVTTTSDSNLSTPSLTETGNLPSGMSFQDNGDGTATLSGSPYPGSNGTYNLTITASEDGTVPDVTQNFTLVVLVGSAPQFTSAASTSITPGTAGSFTITTSGSPAPSLTETGALPSGVSFTDNGDGTATLSGTPPVSAEGTYQFTITAQNSWGGNTQAFTLVVGTAPTITSASATTFMVGQSNTFTVTSTGGPNATLTESGTLPSGVTFINQSNGTAILSGTPTAGRGGTYMLTITADNGVTPDATQSFLLTVNEGPQFTNPSSTVFAVGTVNSFPILTYGFPAPSLTESGTLPQGVTFTDNGDGTATLSGTPTADGIGPYTITLTAHNTSGNDATQSFTLMVGQAPAITSAATTVFGVGQTGRFVVTTVGIPITTLTERGALPQGVTFTDNGDGQATLSGTPAAGTAGLYPVTFTAHNGAGSDAVQYFFLLVGHSPTFTSATSASFGVGGLGSFTITTTGSPAAALTESGALPNGLTLTDNGDGTAILSGTPAAGSSGTYNLILTASNGAGADALQSFTLTVSGQAPTITTAASVTLTVGHSSTFTITTTGSPTAALTESGALPTGITFTNKGNGTATLSGIPAAGTSGTYNLVFTAAASGSNSSTTQAFTLTVYDAPEITSTGSTAFATGAANSFTVTTYGTPTPKLTESGTLPSGISFVDNGNGTATLSGTPAAGSSGTYKLTITAHNGQGNDATQNLILSVSARQRRPSPASPPPH